MIRKTKPSIFSKLFKKKNRSNIELKEANPYLNAKKTWNSYVGSLMSSRLIWQVTALISLLITLCAISGVIYIGSQSKYIPYIVEKDSTGRVTAGGLAYPAASPSDIMYQAAVSDFIFYSRMVTPDVSLQRKAIFKVYSMLSDNDPSITKMNEWMQKDGKSPFERASKEVVNVEIKSVLKQTNNTWQIEWLESVRDRQGVLIKEPFRMRALVTVYQSAPNPSKTLEDMNNNPANIYINDFSWSELN